MVNFTHIGQCDWNGIRLIPEEKCRKKNSSYRGNNLSIKDCIFNKKTRRKYLEKNAKNNRDSYL